MSLLSAIMAQIFRAIAPPAGGDPDFANVVSLLHFDGADASTTFTDVIGRTWTPSGDAQIDTAQSKFGGASGLLDGTGDYITTPSSADFAYGTGDFTWELWYRPATVAGVQYIIEHGTNGGSLIHNTFLRYYNVTSGVGSALYTGGSALTAGVWQHIAVSRESGTTRVFVDGVLMMSGTDNHNYGSQQLRLGSYGSPSSYVNGHIDDFRITKGVARYTANFTPPTEPFPDSAPPAPTTAWTPAYTTTALWLDADDATTITESVGLVSAWADKSPAGVDVSQATEANKPGLGAINGLTAIDFDGADDFLDGGSVFATSDDIAVYAVVTHDSVASVSVYRGLFQFGAYPTGFVLMNYPISSRQRFDMYNNSSLLNTANGTYPNTGFGPLQVGLVKEVGVKREFFDSGSSVVSSAVAASTAAMTTGGNVRVGYQTGVSAGFWDGLVGEIVATTDVSVATRQRIEGYLAHKWGLEGDLPVGHPYKNAAPTTAWTPADTTTALWLDADDASTFTLTGSDVDEWSDKSGNARHATPATATKPTRTATGINSLGSIVFGSGTDPLITPSFAPPAAADGLLALGVFVRTGVPVNYSNLFTWGAVNAQLSLILGSSAISEALGRSKFFFRNDTAGGNTAISPADTIVTSTPLLWAGAISNAAMDQWKNGTLVTGSTGAATRNLGASAVLTIGSSPDASYTSNRVQGQLGEIVLVHADVTTATRQRIEGYLAWKWGLQASLPSGHPYELAAPTITDPYFASVVSLLHFDGADASTTFTDVTGRVWTAQNEAQIDTAQSKFGGSSLLLDGTLDSVTTPDEAGVQVGAGDFTVECFFRPAAMPAVQGCLFAKRNSGGYTPWGVFLRASGAIYGLASTTGTTWAMTGPDSPADVTVGTWHHVAYVRDGDTLRVYLNGVQFQTHVVGATALMNSANDVNVGRWWSTATGFDFNGHIDEFRFTKGVCRYPDGTTFTPPTDPFPDA